MRQFKRKKGFFTIAENTKKTNYLKHAYALALSLKATQKEVPYLSVGISKDMEIPTHYKKVFDEIIEIPWETKYNNPNWKLENEWKVFHITPYEETIKLDADMLFFKDMSNFWNIDKNYSMLACNEVKTYKNELITSDYYRKVFTTNNLPNVYSALFYFKTNEETKQFFDYLEVVTNNYEKFFYEYLDENRPNYFSTDVAYALVSKIFDIPLCHNNLLTFTHMKTHLQNWNNNELDENWTKYVNILFNDNLKCKIENFLQTGILHYHVKSFLTNEIIKYYEDKVL